MDAAVPSTDKPDRPRVRFRILFVTPVTPFSTASGAEQRSALMLQALADLGEVDVLRLSHAAATRVSRDDAVGQRSVVADVAGADLSFGRYRPKPGLTRLVESALGRSMAQYDLVVGRYVWPVCQLYIPEHVPVVVDLDDWQYRRTSQAPWSWRSVKTVFAKWLAHRWCKRQLRRFSGVWLVSELDWMSNAGMTTRMLYNVPALSGLAPSPVPATPKLLFVGSLWYQPNIDGVEWFLAQVWPKVLQDQPQATLTLAGAAPPDVRERWQRHTGVVAPGFVDDLAEVYASARLVIVPIHSGGGSNIKVLEALAYGRPCLTTRLAQSAFASQLEPDVHLLVADQPGEFIERALNVLRDPSSFQKLADEGMARVNAVFTRDSFMDGVTALVREVMKTRQPGQ